MRDLSWPKRVFLILAAAFYVVAGILHFTATNFYLKIMPPYIPAPRDGQHQQCWRGVGWGGICNSTDPPVGGLGISRTPDRGVSGQFVYGDESGGKAGAAGLSAAIRWGRLPVQVILIAWVLWASKGDQEHG